MTLIYCGLSSPPVQESLNPGLSEVPESDLELSLGRFLYNKSQDPGELTNL